ncbi:MAG: hypothetical protein F4X25_04585 [Chloroflexi bacterium]|nr:hypothetical protein [Chloroflexota bacterium]
MVAARSLRLIEGFYPPEQLQTASPVRRLAAAVWDATFFLLTLGFGWLIALILLAPRGQTFGKQMVGLYVMRDDGSRAGGSYTLLREVIVKGVLFGWGLGVLADVVGDIEVLGLISSAAVSLDDVAGDIRVLGLIARVVDSMASLHALLWLLAALWCVWDRDRQCLWDKVVSTHVAYSPTRWRPPTAAELRRRGEDSPSRARRASDRRSPRGPAGGLPAPTVPAVPTTAAERATRRLRELQSLRDEGLITPEQYEERRAAILDEL